MFKIFVNTIYYGGDFEEFDGILYERRVDAQVAIDKALEDPVLGLEINAYYIKEVNS